MKRALFALLLSAAFTPNSMALVEEIETVTVWGTSGGGATGGGYGGGGGDWGGQTVTIYGSRYQDSQDSDVYAAGLNIGNLSPDVRCNPVAQANELVRTTTWQSDQDTKFLAANTLFRLIYAQTGGSAMQAALALLPKAANIMNGTKNAVLWTTTWHDGSTSTFMVFPFIPPLFTDQQPDVRGNTPPPAGDNNDKCPAKG